MTARSPGAFMLSAGFHALIILLLFLLGVVANRQSRVPTRVLELVAGEGDNFGATEAPKLGTPGGLKVDIPVIPVPKAEPEPPPVEPPAPAKLEPPPPEPAPLTPAPAPPPKTVPPPVKKVEVPAKKAEPPTTPNFSKQILRKALNAERAAKKEVAKQREAEQKRLRKEEFDRQQRAKAVAATKGAGAPKIAKIDAEGIAKGVVGGSANNKTGGAGGKALVATDGAITERYFAMLKQRVLLAIDKPPAVGDRLAVTIVVHISASGRLSNPRVVKSSGSDEWDDAVVAAFGRVSMPDHPERKNEDLELIFTTKEMDER